MHATSTLLYRSGMVCQAICQPNCMSYCGAPIDRHTSHLAFHSPGNSVDGLQVLGAEVDRHALARDGPIPVRLDFFPLRLVPLARGLFSLDFPRGGHLDSLDSSPPPTSSPSRARGSSSSLNGGGGLCPLDPRKRPSLKRCFHFPSPMVKPRKGSSGVIASIVF